MTKDELIVKQQLEIEELKQEIVEHKSVCGAVREILWYPAQWSSKSPRYPEVATEAIAQALNAIDNM